MRSPTMRSLFSIVISLLLSLYFDSVHAFCMTAANCAGPLAQCQSGFDCVALICQVRYKANMTPCANETACTHSSFCDGSTLVCPLNRKLNGIPCATPPGVEPSPCQSYQCLNGACVSVLKNSSMLCGIAPPCFSQPRCSGVDDRCLPPQVLKGDACGTTAPNATDTCRGPSICSDRGDCEPTALDKGARCRAAVDACDLPEFCDGNSLECPLDLRSRIPACDTTKAATVTTMQTSESDSSSSSNVVASTLSMKNSDSKTLVGPAQFSEPTNNTALIAGIVGGVGGLLLFIAAIAVVVVVARNRRARRKADATSVSDSNTVSMSTSNQYNRLSISPAPTQQQYSSVSKVQVGQYDSMSMNQNQNQNQDQDIYTVGNL
jgi:hypothetical protein